MSAAVLVKKIALAATVIAAAGAANAASYTFTFLDYPGAGAPGAGATTSALGINDHGDVVGYYNDSAGLHGFLYHGGTYTALNAGAAAGTIATDIANDGRVLGTYESGSGSRGLFYNGSSYELFDAADNVFGTYSVGIGANSGQVAGYVMDGNGFHGFTGYGATFNPFDYPNAIATRAQGINDAGQVVGYFYQNSNSREQGFVYTNGAFTALNHPDATRGTLAWGINDSGVIVGSYVGAQGRQGFVYDGSTWSALAVPGALEVVLLDINAAGQIVGSFMDGTGNVHSFIATPEVPIPAAAWLFGSALLGLCGVPRKKRVIRSR